MLSLPVVRRWLVFQVVLGLLISLISSVSAEDDPQAKQRLKLIQEAVSSLEPESAELKTKAALTFASKPLLRYSDPTRGPLLDACVWRLGTEGRPTALVTVELYQPTDAPRKLCFEFLSLSKAEFALRHKTKKIPRWASTESGLTLKELPGAPKPAATAVERLVQMRRLARRFTAKEHFQRAEFECRLLTQPIDRYQSKTEKIVDGAIFVFVNSTNPELGVVFETAGDHWFYGTLRMTAAILHVKLDGRQVAVYDSPSESYQNGSYRLGMDE